jgi:hypothetical protein
MIVVPRELLGVGAIASEPEHCVQLAILRPSDGPSKSATDLNGLEIQFAVRGAILAVDQ